jgi:hypothetical protein
MSLNPYTCSVNAGEQFYGIMIFNDDIFSGFGKDVANDLDCKASE